MKKIILTFILILIVNNWFFAQHSFNVEYVADYKLSYKLKNTKNATADETTFALLIGNNESYFKNMNQYIGDSLTLTKKLFDTGNILKDVSNFSPYYTEFPENIGVTDAKIYVSTSISKKNFKYEEANNIKWTLLNEFKTISNLKCQKATTYKYGRKWFAYFSIDIPFPYGPYKFSKLPGLIVELFDEDEDFHYTMYNFKKRKYICKSANMYVDAKLVEKEKVYDVRRKTIGNTNRFDNIITDPEMLRKLRSKSNEMAKTYNPIELKME